MRLKVTAPLCFSLFSCLGGPATTISSHFFVSPSFADHTFRKSAPLLPPTPALRPSNRASNLPRSHLPRCAEEADEERTLTIVDEPDAACDDPAAAALPVQKKMKADSAEPAAPQAEDGEPPINGNGTRAATMHNSLSPAKQNGTHDAQSSTPSSLSHGAAMEQSRHHAQPSVAPALPAHNNQQSAQVEPSSSHMNGVSIVPAVSPRGCRFREWCGGGEDGG